MAPLRVLWIATKSPWPPRDGGRLLQWRTLEQLAALDVEVELVAPVPRGDLTAATAALAPLVRPRLLVARPRPLPLAVALATLRRLPVTAVRHTLPGVQRRARALALERAVDVVHAEQAQAMPQALAAARALEGGDGRVVLRAQNVESDLWRGAPGAPTRWSRWRAIEARRLAEWEGGMVRRAARAVALTTLDAARLSALAAGAPVEVQHAPFPAELSPGPPLPGEPALTLLAGSGWAPNREGAERFLADTWPRVRARAAGAVLHVFGAVGAGHGRAAGVVLHEAPGEASGAFPAEGILVVPLALASGVRMKILEAWARGVPVAATPAAAAGLDATDGEELLVGEQGEALAAALVALAGDAALRERLRRRARDLLRRRHDPARAVAALRETYATIAATPSR